MIGQAAKRNTEEALGHNLNIGRFHKAYRRGDNEVVERLCE